MGTISNRRIETVPIRLECAGCGKVFQARDDLVGKRVKCPCGRVLTVPPPTAGSADPAWEDEIGQLFEPAATPLKRAEPPEPAPKPAVAPATTPGSGSKASPPPEAKTPARKDRKADPKRKAKTTAEAVRGIRSFLPPPSAWKPDPQDPWPTRMAIVAVLCGSVLLASEVVVLIRTGGSGPFSATSHILLNAAMVYGGILIVKKDRMGATWVGLSCLLYVFLPFLGLLWVLNTFLGGGPMAEFLQSLGLWLAQYTVPLVLAVWGLRWEIKRTEEEERKKEEEQRL
jgi:hypothetical protein